MTVKRKAVILGGYGLIGAACCRALLRGGFDVVGVGRSVEAGQRAVPGIPWLARDIARTDDWTADFTGADVVVNAAGALQDGLRDDLHAIHVEAVGAMLNALKGRQKRLIHISAAGVSPDAATAFFRTKAVGDALIRASGVDHVILRPVLVLGPQAYGGTALLRAVAALPVEPLVLPDAPVACVALEDVAQAVVLAAEGGIPAGTVADLTEPAPRSFRATVRATRRWLGLPDWRHALRAPAWVVSGIGRLADGLGWLGWRSPLRTTALRQIAAGVEGDPEAWRRAGGPDCRSLPAILDLMPATSQERLFARTWPLLPALVGGLAIFWLLSGLIGLILWSEATAVLTARGVSGAVAAMAVGLGSALDLMLGGAVLVRRFAPAASLGMIAVSLGYLLAGSVVAGDLWADPLGPFVKILPVILAAATLRLMLDER